MKIQILREKAGLSKTEVAQRLGLDLSTVCHWESGASVPRTDKLPLLANLFDCTIDELYGRASPDRADSV